MPICEVCNTELKEMFGVVIDHSQDKDYEVLKGYECPKCLTKYNLEGDIL